MSREEDDMPASRLAFLVAAMVLGFPASAQQAAAPLDCIDLVRLDRADVIDDQTILFHMNNREVLRSSLPSKCPGLASEERFMYRVTMNRLCSTDIITVLYHAGFGLVEGPSCRLGDFEPISQEAARALAKPERAATDTDGK